MLRHKHINKICWAVLALTLVISTLFVAAAAAGWVVADTTIGYENRLFDTGRVHTIDIVMNDWDGFLDTCTTEEYSSCTIVIDGERYANVGIRGKGNTSLTQVAAYGNDRYSFKVEFDRYSTGNGYYGLDKLSLNNIISDNTYMKDYLTYQMMGQAGAAAPLCSFVYITVNGQDWGLYLAVEGVENSFLQRNYGRDYGELYKPDSTGFGGGRGNGAGFNMEDFMNNASEDDASTPVRNNIPSMEGMPTMPGEGEGIWPQGGGFGNMPEGFDPSTLPEGFSPGNMPEGFDMPGGGGMRGNRGGGMGGGMGSSDVRLQYTDDNPDSYTNIFNNAKTDISEADQQRLIASLKQLTEGETIEAIVDVEAVIRYLVVHHFVCNADSYTGSMVHNYYLYEEDGVLSMIPWDYNLAFGGMGMNMGGTDATSEVNAPIDTPVSGGNLSDRPMIAWIFENEEYTALYHQYYAEFMATCFDSGYFEQMMDETKALIAPYVQKDPTAFCTYEEFLTGFETLRAFCTLRAQSVSGQLGGTIPSTQEAQNADSSALIDAPHISIADMGAFMGGGMRGGQNMPDRQRQSNAEVPDMSSTDNQNGEGAEPGESIATSS